MKELNNILLIVMNLPPGAFRNPEMPGGPFFDNLISEWVVGVMECWGRCRKTFGPLVADDVRRLKLENQPA